MFFSLSFKKGALIQKFEAGYAAGAQAVNPDITIDVKYLGTGLDGLQRPGGQGDSPAMIEGGADVIYHAAGQSGRACSRRSRRPTTPGRRCGRSASTPTRSETTPACRTTSSVILTSMIKRVDVAVFETIQAVNDGNVRGRCATFDLAADGVGYSTTGGHIDDIVDQLEDFKQQIINGEIEVPTRRNLRAPAIRLEHRRWRRTGPRTTAGRWHRTESRPGDGAIRLRGIVKRFPWRGRERRHRPDGAAGRSTRSSVRTGPASRR